MLYIKCSESKITVKERDTLRLSVYVIILHQNMLDDYTPTGMRFCSLSS